MRRESNPLGLPANCNASTGVAEDHSSFRCLGSDEGVVSCAKFRRFFCFLFGWVSSFMNIRELMAVDLMILFVILTFTESRERFVCVCWSSGRWYTKLLWQKGPGETPSIVLCHRRSSGYVSGELIGGPLETGRGSSSLRKKGSQQRLMSLRVPFTSWDHGIGKAKHLKALILKDMKI